MIEHALRIALGVHSGQRDRYERPYILHPLTVALHGDTDDEIITGLLHDVIEDSEEWTTERFRVEGFPRRITEAVDCLSKREGEVWDDYIDRVVTDELAMRVKLNDLRHNMDARRMDSFGEKDAERFNRYLAAYRRITSALQGSP
ncbi:MAG: hypothetical protein CL946_12170 [Ectothiorhodospiraceae bacterium]|nr:hypothetical protein [Ectothiorhodospiraceae bacterium]